MVNSLRNDLIKRKSRSNTGMFSIIALTFRVCRFDQNIRAKRNAKMVSWFCRIEVLAKRHHLFNTILSTENLCKNSYWRLMYFISFTTLKYLSLKHRPLWQNSPVTSLRYFLVMNSSHHSPSLVKGKLAEHSKKKDSRTRKTNFNVTLEWL